MLMGYFSYLLFILLFGMVCIIILLSLIFFIATIMVIYEEYKKNNDDYILYTVWLLLSLIGISFFIRICSLLIPYVYKPDFLQEPQKFKKVESVELKSFKIIENGVKYIRKENNNYLTQNVLKNGKNDIRFIEKNIDGSLLQIHKKCSTYDGRIVKCKKNFYKFIVPKGTITSYKK